MCPPPQAAGGAPKPRFWRAAASIATGCPMRAFMQGRGRGPSGTIRDPMFRTDETIADFDPELARALEGERRRQEDLVELIASENYTRPRVLAAQGSVLTNKYAEGY